MTSEQDIVERLARIRLYAQDMLDTCFLSGSAVGNAMSIRDEVDAVSAEISSLRSALAEALKERDEARAWQRQHRNKRDVARAAARANHDGIEHWKDRARAAESSLDTAVEALREIDVAPTGRAKRVARAALAYIRRSAP